MELFCEFVGIIIDSDIIGLSLTLYMLTFIYGPQQKSGYTLYRYLYGLGRRHTEIVPMLPLSSVCNLKMHPSEESYP